MLKINGIKYEFDSFYSGDVRVKLDEYDITPNKINIVEYKQESSTENHKDLAIEQFVLVSLYNAVSGVTPFEFHLDTLPFERNDKEIGSGKDRYAPMKLFQDSTNNDIIIKSVVHGGDLENPKRRQRDALTEQLLDYDLDIVYVFPDESARMRYGLGSNQPHIVYGKKRDEDGNIIDYAIEKKTYNMDKWRGYKFVVIDDILSMGGSAIRVAEDIIDTYDDKTLIEAKFSKAESSAWDKHMHGDTDLFLVFNHVDVKVFI